MVFGKQKGDYCSLMLNGSAIEYVHEWKYLGTTVTDGISLGFSARPDLSSFFRATNSILNALTNAHNQTLVTLLYTNCVPILTYACGVKQYSPQEMSNCNVALNNALRKIFGFTDWRSIRLLRGQSGVESLYVIFKKTQDRFIDSCKEHQNSVVRHVVLLNNST